jgi:hexosaminidase
VVPEIDVPGHCYAMLKALPDLRDPDETGAAYSIQEFPNNCLNPAVPAVMTAVTTIFDELIELFPAPWFHVGADEVPEDAWSGSPLAQAMLKKIGGTSAADLQAAFLRQVQAHLTARGKVTGAWEEAAQGGGIDSANCYLVGWHAVEASQMLARAGYEVVVAPGQAFYLDMANGPEWAEPGANWAGWSSPQKTYGFVPDEGWSEAERERLMGVQACIWAEPTARRDVARRLVFPRLSAVAETGWSFPENKSWPRFAALAPLMPVL